ncbi:hypothetical protein CBL_02785 [Carabus blaptoides fortunei]
MTTEPSGESSRERRSACEASLILRVSFKCTSLPRTDESLMMSLLEDTHSTCLVRLGAQVAEEWTDILTLITNIFKEYRFLLDIGWDIQGQTYSYMATECSQIYPPRDILQEKQGMVGVCVQPEVVLGQPRRAKTRHTPNASLTYQPATLGRDRGDGRQASDNYDVSCTQCASPPS